MNTEEKLIERVEGELDPVDTEQAYCDMLDDCFSFDSVGGIFATMQPSRVLKEVDPIAYRCGHNDYIDSECKCNTIEEINDDYYDADEVQAIRDEIEEEEENDLSIRALKKMGLVDA